VANVASVSAAAPVAPPSAVARATATASATLASVVPPDMALARNIEQVPYCVLYPAPYLKPDSTERLEHGHQVFRSQNGRSKMSLSPSCGTRTLAQMFDDDKQDIQKKHPGVAFTVSSIKGDGYALSYAEAGHIFYGKLWKAKDDPGCFVKAVFEYDVSERAIWDQALPKIVAQGPGCPATP
jgi:hypothetical protein